MTPLREQMIRELELQRKSANTIEAYVAAVADLAGFYDRSPDHISVEEIRDFLHHVITQRKGAFSTCNQKLAGIKFFYQHVLRRPELELRVPAKKSGRLPEPFSRSEVRRVIDATRKTKYRALLMTAYGGGLRVAELVCLEPRHIHSERMLIRVDQGKGHKESANSDRAPPSGIHPLRQRNKNRRETRWVDDDEQRRKRSNEGREFGHDGSCLAGSGPVWQVLDASGGSFFGQDDKRAVVIDLGPFPAFQGLPSTSLRPVLARP